MSLKKKFKMANKGKFKDRYPSLRAAGFSAYESSENVANCLTFVSLQEKIDAALGSCPKLPRMESFEQKPNADMYCGYYTQIRSLISPPKTTFFKALESELKETAYTSYWKRELGALPDQVPGLPFGTVPGEITFGKPTPRSETVQEVVNPKITSGEVNLIAELGHELYRKTHNNYYPGEQKTYNYSSLPFPQKNIYGMRTNTNPEGTAMSDLLHWHNLKEFIVGPQNLARYKQRYSSEIGKKSNRHDESLLPELSAVDKKSLKREYSVEESLRNYRMNEEKQILNNAISYIFELRKIIRKKYPPFSFVDFLAAFKNADEERCECLPQEKFYEISEEKGLKFNQVLIEPLLKKLGILHGTNNLVNYRGITNLIDARHPFPDIGKVQDLPDELSHPETNYQSSHLSTLNKKKEIEDIRPAGLPIAQLRYSYNYLQSQQMIKANLDDFPTSTTVESCLSPGLFPSLGVSHKDFFQPRTKAYIRDIHERINVKFPDEIFEKLWEEAERRDGDRVCIETFRNILEEITAAKLNQGGE